jgi:hypothetical protein
MGFWQELAVELIGAAFTLIVGWVVGERIVARWDLKKKQQELDITIAQEFHRLYGEFKDVSRLWRTYKYDGSKPNIELPKETPVELIRRASAAEGGVEAIMVKLSAERVLEPGDVRALGLFRQAYQRLREAIREDLKFEWTYVTPEYHLYNELAERVARVIAATNVTRQDSTENAIETLRCITDIRPGEWDSEVKACGLRLGRRS